MPPDFKISQNDLLPSFRVKIKDEDGAVVDLTNAVSATFIFASAPGGPSIFTATATIETPKTDGIIRYDWTGTQTATVGTFLAQIRIMWPGTKPQKAPTDSFWTVEIYQDLET